MTVSSIEDFKEAIKSLHRAKDTVYRNAWKKRGEVLSIMANIARKIDRLEYIADGATITTDESALDTAIDLLVYSLKYQTFLADQDNTIAAQLFGTSDMVANYSDGPKWVDFLLSNLDLTKLHDARVPYEKAVKEVLSCFNKLETCFFGMNTQRPVEERLGYVEQLVEATIDLIAILIHDKQALYENFILANSRGDA
jgi:hypothetical protein